MWDLFRRSLPANMVTGISGSILAIVAPFQEQLTFAEGQLSWIIGASVGILSLVNLVSMITERRKNKKH